MMLAWVSENAVAIPCPDTGQVQRSYERCPHMCDELWLHWTYRPAGYAFTEEHP